jgi:uncharacterized protein YndB with AHSA1/START domain
VADPPDSGIDGTGIDGAARHGPLAVVRRVLPAPPAEVYDEWLDPEALSEWMCPRPAHCLRVVCEPRVGGLLRLDIEELGTTFSVTGRFTALERPHHLSFTWTCSTWPTPSHESLVTVRLYPSGADQTLMTIEHALLPPGLTEQHELGWTAIAGQLASALEGSRPR